MSRIIVTAVCLVTIVFCNAQNEFKLLSKNKNADINYLTLKNINHFPVNYDTILSAFQPVKGQYEVFLFIKEFSGLSSIDPDVEIRQTQLFHDLIVLKTDKKHTILDAFLYRVEWAEPPSQFMLFRAFPEDENEDPKLLKLVDNMKVSDLHFVNEYEMLSTRDYDPEYDSLDKYGRRVTVWVNNDFLKLR